MVNFHDPSEVAQVGSVLVKFWHTLAGLYIWEFVTTLDYEWGVIRGHRPYRWSIWIYSLTRSATLVAIILDLILLDTTVIYNCQVLFTLEFISGSVGVAAASFLIVLRIIAIWRRNRVVIVIALAAWGINIAIHLQSVVRLRSVRVPGPDSCIIPNIESTLNLNFFSTLATDIVLLSIMLVGLLRMRRHGGGTFALGRLLWKQGLIWLLLATIAEIPPVIFIILNLNEPFDIMFQLPETIVTTIAATRMHRSMVDFVSGSTKITQEPKGGNLVSKTKQTTAVPIRFKQMEVPMHIAHEQHPTSQTNHHCSYIDINVDGEQPDKSYELSEQSQEVKIPL